MSAFNGQLSQRIRRDENVRAGRTEIRTNPNFSLCGTFWEDIQSERFLPRRWVDPEPSRDRVTTLRFTPMERSRLHRLLLNGDNKWDKRKLGNTLESMGAR